MAQVHCNCGWSYEVPDAMGLRSVTCPTCKIQLIPTKARTPYSYTPFQTWHPAPTVVRVTPAAPAPGNTPAIVSFASGGMALFAALFLVYEKGDKGVVCLALLGMACGIIGMHKSGMLSLRGKGRFTAAHGLLFSVLALMAAPLPAGPSPGKLRRLDTAPAERRYEIPTAPKARTQPAVNPKAAPKPADKSDEQEEGF